MQTLRALTLACGMVGATAAIAAQGIGEELDTPFVITPTNVVTAMLDLAKVRAGDRLIDLGSGDGRIVLAAAQRGAIGLGIEIDARLVEQSRVTARRMKLDDRAKFVTQDLFDADYSSADVVTLYLLPDVNKRLAPKFLATLKAGTRIVSHDYDLGAWPPDAEIIVDAPDKPVNVAKKSHLYYWVVPARVAGRWQGSVGASGITLELAQDYQRVGGTLRIDSREYRFNDVKIDGNTFSLRLEDSPRPLRLELKADGAMLRGRMREGDAAEVALAMTRR
ncbi:MAG TPA: methyltransferase domain-containing protein [Casimicrobiaceae bacterium]|nr:methyltransferase domain-containing protein [Casimicrobiaceae bacterium]